MAEIKGYVRKSICVRGNVKHTYISSGGSGGKPEIINENMSNFSLANIDNATVINNKNDSVAIITGAMTSFTLGTADNVIFEEE